MVIWLAPANIKSTICICHHLRLTMLMGNPSAPPSVLSGIHLALGFIQNRRCVWPLLLSSWRYAALEATRSFPRKIAPFSWSCFASGKWRCQLSFHPVCHPSASLLSACLPLPTYTVPPWTCCSFSHTDHMSLERIYYTISSFRKSSKEASGGDKALRVKSTVSLTDPIENTRVQQHISYM